MVNVGSSKGPGNKKMDPADIPTCGQAITFDDCSDLYIASTGVAGESNTSSNSGCGAGLAQAKCGVDLPFKTITGGSNICLVENACCVTINGAAGSSPLTTKGDVFGFSCIDARVPVGGNGQVLTADCTEALGVKWAAAGCLGLPVADTVSIVEDPVTASKQMRIDVGAVAACTVRVLTMPDANVDLASSGTGNLVRVTSATLVTPALGTPASGVATNITGLPIIAGTTGTLSVARGGTGVTTSTGTTNVVLSNSPTLVTPALGTPASGVLTNATGLPETGLLDNAVTLAKMAGGTDGNLITYDACGNPAAVATGTAAQVLTSNGMGAAPTFQAAGAGGCGFTNVKVTPCDVSITCDNTLTNDTTLQFCASANKTYVGQIHIFWQAQATPDLRNDFVIPTNATGFRNTAWVVGSGSNTADILAGFTTAGTDCTNKVFEISFKIVTGACAGLVAYQWAQCTSNAGATIVRKGSSIFWKEAC